MEEKPDRGWGPEGMGAERPLNGAGGREQSRLGTPTCGPSPY